MFVLVLFCFSQKVFSNLFLYVSLDQLRRENLFSNLITPNILMMTAVMVLIVIQMMMMKINNGDGSLLLRNDVSVSLRNIET